MVARKLVMHRWMIASVLLALLIASCFVPVECAKKKKKAKRDISVDELRCAVCITAVNEIQQELETTENSTNTLDLRWGLTAEVEDGRAKRIGKVIPYKRSELRSIEVMEKVCSHMKNYGTDESVPGEVKLRLLNEIERYSSNDVHIEGQDTEKKAKIKKFESHCHDLVDDNEEGITTAIREGANETQLQDILCYSGPSSPCGVKRKTCQPGTIGLHMGLAPCTLCPYATYQDKEGQMECVPCAAGTNTSGEGSGRAEDCELLCVPGTASSTGLGDCVACKKGHYSNSHGARKCEKCPAGTTTPEERSSTKEACVAACGDGLKFMHEQCDDNNTDAGDGCDSECKIEAGATCTHKEKQASECSFVKCGDAKIEESWDHAIVETCDDGNEASGDGCSAQCSVEEGWACRDGTGKQAGSSVCSQVVCGDFKRAPTEDCDDGNTQDGDGCSSTCTVEAGYLCSGPVERKSMCKRPMCGDGLREGSGDVQEECDDGNLKAGDGCDEGCKLEAGFQCKQGTDSGAVGPPGAFSYRKDRCKSSPVCGDGKRTKPEACDDGNTNDGDGCSSGCTVEKGWTCSVEDEGPDKCKKKKAKAKSEEL